MAETDSIAFAGDWQGGIGPTLVQNTPMRMRVRHLLGNTEMVGFAPSSFDFDGVIAEAAQDDVPGELLFGTDEVFFVATAVGSGGITAHFRGHSIRIPITVISETTLTSLELRVVPLRGTPEAISSSCALGIEAELRAEDTRVFGPRAKCKVSLSPGMKNDTNVEMKLKDWVGGYWPWLDLGGWPGEHPFQQLIAEPDRIGVHNITCHVANLDTPLTLSFDPPPTP